jgi:hypothetical protein
MNILYLSIVTDPRDCNFLADDDFGINSRVHQEKKILDVRAKGASVHIMFELNPKNRIIGTLVFLPCTN